MNHIRRHGQNGVLSKPCAVFSLSLLSVAISCLGAGPAQAKGFLDPIARAGTDIGRGISRAAEAVSHGLSNAGRNAGKRWRGKKPAHPYQLTVRSNIPADPSERHGLGTIPSLNLDYDLRQNRIFGGPSTIGLYAQINDGGRFDQDTSAKYTSNVLGFGIEGKRIFGKSVEKKHFYIGAGIGLYETKYVIDPTGPAKFTKMAYGTGTRLTVGYQFDRRIIGEVNFNSTNSFNTHDANNNPIRISPTSTSIGVGYRF